MTNFRQVDVFTGSPLMGNPVAVVMNAEGISDEDLALFSIWTNLSETTFLLPPTDPAADYRVRIFSLGTELPFAGHPTIGTCHAWLEAGGVPKTDGTIIQECGVGLVTLRQSEGRLAFAAPPLIKDGSPSEEELAPVCEVLQIDRAEIVDAQWADNGPGWIAVMLRDSDAVLDLTPELGAVENYAIGVVGVTPQNVSEAATRGVEDVTIRAFFRLGGAAAEDPVTGSLNAAVAQWLLGNGTLSAPYVASQGTAMGRDGKVYINEAEDEIWVGGDAVTVITGEVVI